MPKYTPFILVINSQTESVAAQAALKAHGFSFPKEHCFPNAAGSIPSYNTVLNFTECVNAKGRLEIVDWGATKEFPNKYGAVVINNITELVAFLDSGKHIVPKETEYVIVQTRVRTVRILAKNAKEAMEQVRGGNGYHLSETFDYQFRDEN